MPEATLTEAEAAVIQRLATDATFVGLVGLGADQLPRVSHRDEEELAELLAHPMEEEFPRAAVSRATDAILHPGMGTVRVQLDLWGRSVLERDKLDAAALAALENVTWSHSGARVHATRAGGSTSGVDVVGTLRLYRRSRDYSVAVS